MFFWLGEDCGASSRSCDENELGGEGGGTGLACITSGREERMREGEHAPRHLLLGQWVL